ncbi:MAG: 30S ribosomal protein S19 [Planctomycetes bacterium]|nr:30S ribosomal protein S19 [Planctomycetota bacterium]MBI3836010.1 30S ribosomal protein S19 [Planctomycetota bacterium]
MTRSATKGPYVTEKLFQKVMNLKSSGRNEVVRTWARDCTIVPEFIGQRFEVHNGKIFHSVYVTEDMIGHKLGEFSPTRQFRGHSGVKKAEAAGAAPAAAPAKK